MFRELWRIAQTDQVLKRYHLDTPEYLEKSRLGASLLMALYTDLSVTKATPGIYIMHVIPFFVIIRGMPYLVLVIGDPPKFLNAYEYFLVP